MRVMYVLIVWIIVVSYCFSRPSDAVVEIAYQGSAGSAVVIHTEKGRSLLLTAAHVVPYDYRGQRVRINFPWPKEESPQNGGRLRLLRISRRRDLALLELGIGPLPYSVKVAGESYKATGSLLSCGYDAPNRFYPRRGKGIQALQRKPTRVVGRDGYFTLTSTPPWHGRSGGGLIDEDTGVLVGICSAYEGEGNRGTWPYDIRHNMMKGRYCSLRSIRSFLSNGEPPLPEREFPPGHNREQFYYDGGGG